MTVDEIYAIPTNCDGWRVLPNGNWIHLGTDVISQIDLAEIGSGAEIGPGAKIGSYAEIGPGAKIGSGVKILEKSVIVKSPLAVQGSRHLAGNYQPGMIQIGCQLHSFEYWTAHVLGIAREHGYSSDEALEYQKIVAFLAANGVPTIKE